jgi:glycosyltransferase involved in cell wall biosynthesis
MLTWEFPPRIVGGIARHCFGLAKALVKEKHEVHVVTLGFPGAPIFEEVDGVKVHRVSIELGHPSFITWTFLFNHFMEKKVATLNRDIDFDLLHIHDWLTASSGITIKYHLAKPLVSTVHSTEIGRVYSLRNPESYLIDGLEWWMIYEASKVIVCSNSMKGELEHHFHIQSEKSSVIPNAIDTSVYSKSFDREAVRRKYGIGPYEKMVLFVGRLVPQKGVEYLVKAVPSIVQNHGGAKFVISGEGWFKSNLENLAARTGYGYRIRFLGFIPDSELIELSMCTDVLVVPSVYEPFGIVALEGMAAGVPVVVSNIGGLADIVEHDRTGVLVYPEKPESIAWGVNKVLSDRRYSDWLTKNAKKHVQKVYSWEAVAKKTSKVYEQACEGDTI